MSYESIDSIQEALAGREFANRKDAKKTAGRALGTVLEIITFYLLKDYGLEYNTAIERSLSEYANPSIGHNVEFTLHAATKLATITHRGDDRTARAAERNDFEAAVSGLLSDGAQKKSNRPFAGDSIRNAATVFDDTVNQKFPSIVNAYPNTSNDTIDIYQLASQPFAMVECKRVGVERGMRKGPQTIEKAKQGAYVALAASRLQKFRRSDGTQMGILENSDGDFLIEPYDELLRHALTELERDEIDGIVLSIGVISDHGNWFTSDNKNKETQVLADAYDWLLFLTDEGLSTFIREVLVRDDGQEDSDGEDSMADVRDAFRHCVIDRQGTFTKTVMPAKADAALTRYFAENRELIAGWFNIITPENGTLEQLFTMLKTLAAKEQSQ
ncbi:hypothetical protein [Bifidobacterium stellenboschense]|uniref:Uncharacterized protein n=1 Tax=Bifidobacterium stellenboschense TaxID=762211 RepID=A0A087DNA4_9BIFI|nr:hypothetical protein [Bifidobacterium stellenboschense]KFI97004.1 hypothetical protein BSTEL_1915 [Bifidobacterium stellenboschense]